jgi:hypothetical protein
VQVVACQAHLALVAASMAYEAALAGKPGVVQEALVEEKALGA